MNDNLIKKSRPVFIGGKRCESLRKGLEEINSLLPKAKRISYDTLYRALKARKKEIQGISVGFEAEKKIEEKKAYEPNKHRRLLSKIEDHGVGFVS
jgi:hypothetical protein